jgi:hypothetical protein
MTLRTALAALILLPAFAAGQAFPVEAENALVGLGQPVQIAAAPAPVKAVPAAAPRAVEESPVDLLALGRRILNPAVASAPLARYRRGGLTGAPASENDSSDLAPVDMPEIDMSYKGTRDAEKAVLKFGRQQADVDDSQ